ncbi:MAG: hypothetical protein ACREDJ_05675 [Methylocella sp.]
MPEPGEKPTTGKSARRGYRLRESGRAACPIQIDYVLLPDGRLAQTLWVCDGLNFTLRRADVRRSAPALKAYRG